MGKLDGRVAIVTGSGRGIGASLARIMAREGAAVVVNDVGHAVDGSETNERPADEVVNEIKKAGGNAVANFGSVADHEQAEQLIKTALDEFGRLDILVTVAGILRDRMIFNLSEEDWDAVINVHLKGTFNTAKFASIYWRATREGNCRLINFTSESGLFGAPGQPNYAAAKMGIVGLTYSCANALAGYGVRSNAIAPIAGTRMTQGIKGGGSLDYSAENKRLAPENVVPPVVYLASEQSEWLNRRIIFAGNGRISLMTNPVFEREIISASGTWDIPTAFAEIEASFKGSVSPNIFDKPPAS